MLIENSTEVKTLHSSLGSYGDPQGLTSINNAVFANFINAQVVQAGLSILETDVEAQPVRLDTRRCLRYSSPPVCRLKLTILSSAPHPSSPHSVKMGVRCSWLHMPSVQSSKELGPCIERLWMFQVALKRTSHRPRPEHAMQSRRPRGSSSLTL